MFTIAESLYKLMNGPITVERLKCCDWSIYKFIEVNFSKLSDSKQIFRIDFVRIHYHLGEISWKVIECNFLFPYELSTTITTLWYGKTENR